MRWCSKMGCSPLIEGSALMDEPPYREGEDPHKVSTYQRFWSDATKWDVFLKPGYAQGPAINTTKTEPGVYEFGVSMPQARSTIVPLYVGKSTNVRQRHLGYLNQGGGHIAELFGPMLEDGCTVWQRVRYLKSDLQAQRWEARFLVDYDYAWNAVLNPPKRHVHLEHRECCCMPVGVDVVGQGQRVSILSTPLKSCTTYTGAAALVIQILIAMTVILIVALQLGGTPQGEPGSTLVTSECLLGTDAHGKSLCVYTYIVSGTSMGLSLIMSILMASGLKVNTCGRALNAIVAVFMAIWWCVAAIVLTRYMAQADVGAVPGQDWRQAVVILSWIMVGVWGVSWLVIAMLGVLKMCAGKAKARDSGRYGGGDMPNPSAPTAPEVSPPGKHPQFMTSHV